MKILTKEEEQAHYAAVVRGGVIGGAAGLALGLGGMTLATRRWPAVRGLTLPFKAFFVSSTTTFGAITTAERASLSFAQSRDPMSGYKDSSERAVEALRAQESGRQKALDWMRDHRYGVVVASWAGAMGIALAMVGRNKYLTTSQKVVQARVYAQGLTLAVLVATGLLEASDAKTGKGRWETVMVLDPEDPEHKHLIEKRVHKEEYEGQDLWKDMVASEERRLEKQKHEREVEKQQQQKQEEKQKTSQVGAPAQ